MNLLEILDNIEYIKVLNKQDILIDTFKTDTRKITKGDVFIGIKGSNFDGNKLYQEAFLNGANVCFLEYIEENIELLDYLKNNNKTIIIVKDTTKTIGFLASFKRRLFKNKVIAITGSSGKTSTKDIVSSILSQKYNVYKTKGNLNNHLGLPLSILEADFDCDYWILEMGMNHLKEISYLSTIAQPTIAIITNIGTSHIGNLGSRKNILKAKLEILDGLNSNGYVLINNDNDLLNKWALKNKKYNIKTIGIENISNYQAKNIKLRESISEFVINDNHIQINIGGIPFIYNALIGYAIGVEEGMNFLEINKGINELSLSQNRMNIINVSGFKIIDDCYNSNYDSCQYSLKYLSNFHGRKIAVLGSMLELGRYSKKYHKMLGKIIVNEQIDVLITVGKYTNLINLEAQKLGFNKESSFHYENNYDAIDKLKEIISNDDIILVKASHSMKFNEIVENLQK